MEMGKERWTGEKCHVNCERKEISEFLKANEFEGKENMQALEVLV